MKVLVACEFSGVVRDAFRARGHDAVSCDLLPSERPGPHLQGDALQYIGDGWDMMIAHPPCTYLTNSGVWCLHRDKDRWEKMRDGAAFFKALLNADIPRIAVENPIMHKYAAEIIGRRQDQTIQPWQFGHPESKATGLWLKGLPKLMPTKVLKRPASGRWENQTPSGRNKIPPSADRWKKRSITYPGIAEAMASQWGNPTNNRRIVPAGIAFSAFYNGAMIAPPFCEKSQLGDNAFREPYRKHRLITLNHFGNRTGDQDEWLHGR